MNKNTIMVIAMVVLFLFAAAQAVELTSIKKQVAENDFSSVGSATVGSSSSGLSTKTTALDELPGMVGGC